MRIVKSLIIVIGLAMSLSACTATTQDPVDTNQTNQTDRTNSTNQSNTPVPSQSKTAVKCNYISDGEAAKPVKAPSNYSVTAVGTLQMEMKTDAGSIIINLDRASAPCAVHSFESLAAQGFFDDTNCHRLEVGFVLQCGDPTEQGTGGPGYRFATEGEEGRVYTYGTIAMANTGEASSNGSQFFIMLGDRSFPEGYNYSIMGSVDPESMKVVEDIQAKGWDLEDPDGNRLAAGHIISIATI